MSTFISLAAEAQPGSLHVASTRTHTRSDTPIPSSDIGQRSFEPMHIDVANPLASDVAHPHASPSTIVDVASLHITVAARHQLPVIVSRPSTVDVRKTMHSVGRRQSKSSVPIGMNEPTFGSMHDESRSVVTGFTSVGTAEPRPTSIDVGHPLSKGVVRPSPTHVRPTPTSMSAGPIPAHVVYPSSVGTHVMPRPTLADDESAMRQSTSAYTGQYATVCTGLQV